DLALRGARTARLSSWKSMRIHAQAQLELRHYSECVLSLMRSASEILFSLSTRNTDSRDHQDRDFTFKQFRGERRLNVREIKTLDSRYCISNNRTQSLFPVLLVPGGVNTRCPVLANPLPASL